MTISIPDNKLFFVDSLVPGYCETVQNNAHSTLEAWKLFFGYKKRAFAQRRIARLDSYSDLPVGDG